MPETSNGTMTIHFEEFGDRADPTLLLVMGFTAQMTVWDREWCTGLVDRGYHVVRFDNRDVGLSGRTPPPVPDLLTLITLRAEGAEMPPAPYTLRDMAADGVAVLDAVEADRAHVVGASMGGMIVQTMAIEFPERVATMTSIMSTPSPDDGPATPEAMGALLSPVPEDRDGAIERSVEVSRTIGGPLFDEERSRAAATLNYDRSVNPLAAAYQMAAIASSPSRTEALGSIAAPTLVIHGRHDPLISLPGGEATAAAIPGSALLVLDEMGHDLPPALWGAMFDAIDELTGI